MTHQGSGWIKRFYRPQPMGWLFALLSAALLLWAAWHLGGWQAREAERGGFAGAA